MDRFGVAVVFGDDEVRLDLRGEIDVVTAPDLNALIGAAIDSSDRGLIVDLGDVTFIGSAGIAVLTQSGHRLVQEGRTLRVRHASRLVRHVLEIEGLADVVRFDVVTPDGPPDPTDFTEHALRLVVNLARASLSGADGASLTLRRDGVLVTVAASDRTILEMDMDQYTTGEGPCIDAATTGRRVRVGPLGADPRWPAFTPRALTLGINAVISSPLLSGDEPVGALNIYSLSESAFRPKDEDFAALFAEQASTVVTHGSPELHDERLAASLQEILRCRESVSVAQGSIMERWGVRSEDAYTILASTSEHVGNTLREEAEAVLSTTGW